MGNGTQNLINLVTDVQNGVDGAFEKLYHESFRHAYCTASLLLKNEQDIEDALQNSYMYVAKYIKDLKSPERFNNWLGVIVKHECQKYISKQKHISDIFAAVKKTKEFDLIVDENLTDEYIEKSELRDAIQRIVDDLPDDKRACVVLFYYEQHSLTEISEILGVPEGTVMSRLFYARKKLEKEFKKLQKKDESLFGISIIPLIVSLLTYQVKTMVIPPAVESGIVAVAVVSSVAGTATVSSVAGTSTAATAVSTASVATGASGAASAAGTAVAAKVTAVAVAASVAVGGGVATVNHIRNNNEAVTIQTSIASTVEHITAASIIDYETTDYSAEATTLISASQTESVSSKTIKTSVTKMAETTESKRTETTTQKKKKQTTTAKMSEEAKPTTTKLTTTMEATTNEITKQTTTEVQKTETTNEEETTTKKVTTTVEQTTNITDIFNVSDGVLSEYTGNESDVSIPSKVGSSSVTAIGTGAFMGNANITSVSIPSTVTRIGMEAFSDCLNLRSISLPSSLESIGVAAFYGCSSLTSVTIPDGTKTISDEAFSYCTSLTSITIPDSVTSISEDAFYGSDNVTIRCSEGSVAYNYAVENSINYELI